MSRANRLIFTATAMLVFGVAGSATGQDRPDFSGTWKMDPDRSESAHQAVPIGPVTLIIKQTGAEVTIETRRAEGQKSGTRREMLTYKLDGSESTTSGPEGAAIKCRAHWEGTKLVTQTTRNIQAATVTTHYVHSLDPSGKELTVEKTLTVQHGYQFEGAKSYGSGTDVFVKMKVGAK